MTQLTMAVPVVVAQRVTRMALAGAVPSASDRREMKSMSQEKVAAFSESWHGIAAKMAQAYLNFGFDLMRLAWSPWHQSGDLAKAATERFNNAASTSLDGSLAPLRRRAVANAKRLGSKSLG